MGTQTNLVQRGSRYYFRKKVPTELIGRIGPRSGAIRESLGDGLSLIQAKAEAARRAAEWEKRFEVARKALAPRQLVSLTPELVPTLTQALQAHVLTADEELRTNGLDDTSFERLEAEVEADLATCAGHMRGATIPKSAPNSVTGWTRWGASCSCTSAYL